MSSSSGGLENFNDIFDNAEKLQKLSDRLKEDPSSDKNQKALIDVLIERMKEYSNIVIELEESSSSVNSKENVARQNKLLELIKVMNNIGKEIYPDLNPLKPHYVGQSGNMFFMGDIDRDKSRGGKSRRRRYHRSHRSRRRNRRSSKKYKKDRKSRRRVRL